MMEPLVKTIEVPCNQEKAFTVFMDMGSWWPKDKFATSVMRGHTVKALRVDATEGGQIVEVGSDGQEQLWRLDWKRCADSALSPAART